MVSLLSEQADRCGIPSSETVPPSQELRQKALKLIRQIFERERATPSEENPKSFGACLEWVEPDYPNIAALAEEFITSSGFGKAPPLRGWRWVKERAQLIGCGVFVVLFMFLVVIVWSLISSRK
jgi:hypothetical protein